MVNVLPVQLPEVGVTVYVAVPVLVVAFVKVWLMLLCPVACALPPVSDPAGLIEGAPHVYVVPAGTPEGVTLKAPPLHIVAVLFVIAGTGFTVIVTVNVLPAQLPEVGVTV